ncbi:MAG: hypothetical protein IJS45_08540 [Clostridia bacterium]|nr:hypothetical protein [Clostridia bacterium]
MDMYDYFWGLIYIISCYEKSRISSKRIWTANFLKSISDSINIISLLLNAIETGTVESDTLYTFCKDNIGKIMPVSTDLEKLKQTIESNDSLNKKRIIKSTELFNTAKRIVVMCQLQIHYKNHFYKYNLWCLFMGLHNIPRAFISLNHIDVYNISVDLINEKEAKNYVKAYLDKMQS